MHHRNKIIALFSFLAFIMLGIAAVEPDRKFQKRNLKVLPQNISDEALDSIMDNYKAALGVKCNYCHTRMKDDPKRFDFASDDKPEKEIARQMMRMTNDINKKYFNFNNIENTDEIQAVNCKTCHRGEPHPEIPPR